MPNLERKEEGGNALQINDYTSSILNSLVEGNRSGYIQAVAKLDAGKIETGLQISKLRKHDVATLMVVLQRMIEDFFDFFKLSNKPDSEADLVPIVLLVQQEFYYLKLEEIAYVLHGAKAGRYGKIYNRVDGSVICDFLREYDKHERSKHFGKAKLLQDTEKERRESARLTKEELFERYKAMANKDVSGNAMLRGEKARKSLQDIPGFEDFNKRYWAEKKKQRESDDDGSASPA